MKFFIPALLFLASFFSPQDVSLQKEYNKSSFVALAKIRTLEDDYFQISLLEVYKSDFLETQIFITEKERHNNLMEGEIYLLFATPGEKLYELHLSETIKPILKKDIPLSSFLFLNGQPCINENETFEAIKRRHPEINNIACERGGRSRLCGCNGKQYFSVCESHRDGVVKYRVSQECEN